MNKISNEEINFLIQSKKDLYEFFEVLTKFVGKKTASLIYSRAKRHIRDNKKCTLDFDDKSTFLP